jgi:predicted ATPase/class 3 adenylate cyclase
MSAPSGTVTFLFTDIEGSTGLWDAAPAAMRLALARHDAILRFAIESHGGHIFATGGDGFAAAFGRVVDAVAAATDAQSSLSAESWPAEATIAVRMGLHTGEVEERGGDYFGPGVNRAARVMAAGHGGQVLVSAATASLIGTAGLADLGEHRFAGLSAPERVFQIGSRTFPPLRGAAAVPTNLPIERTSFVGRDQEINAVATSLRSLRLVTLTGVGGVGKTRLAAQVAAGMLDEFPDGVWLVELAPLIDALLVPTAVASAIGAPPSPGVETTEVVCRFLAQRRALLLLDNCEHVVDATAKFVDRLLIAAPRIRVLTTSREPLGVQGESVWRVPSLPAEGAAGEIGDAAALFAARAMLVSPTFTLDEQTRAYTVQVCRRLDGIPLAIELAAPRVRSMSVEQIADRLDERFRLLTRGGRTAVARQQTLQAAIDWSYQLLTPDERDLFDLLAVFTGDFDLTAATAVSGRDEFEVLDLLDELADKSMLEADPSRDRYRLLETLRQYGWGRLTAADRLLRARVAHAGYFAALADEQGTLLRTPGRQVAALDRLEADYDNLRAALAWLIESRQAVQAAQVLSRIIDLFMSRHPAEGLGWFRQVIGISDELPASTRSQLFGFASAAALQAGDHESQGHYAQTAINLGGPDAPAIAYVEMSRWQVTNGQPALAVESARRGLAATSDLTVKVLAYTALLVALGAAGAEPEVRTEIPVLLDLAETLGNPTLRGAAYVTVGEALDLIGDRPEAEIMYRTAVTYASVAGARVKADALVCCALTTDDPSERAAMLRAAIAMSRDQLSGGHGLNPLIPAAKLASGIGASREAARLIGAYQHHIRGRGGPEYPMVARWCTRLQEDLTTTLTTDQLEVELTQGAQLTLDAALSLATDVLDREASSGTISGTTSTPLPRLPAATPTDALDYQQGT